MSTAVDPRVLLGCSVEGHPSLAADGPAAGAYSGAQPSISHSPSTSTKTA